MTAKKGYRGSLFLGLLADIPRILPLSDYS